MTQVQDLARRVNTPLSMLHHLWVERVLHIPYRWGNGVDLYDSKRRMGVEIKFSKIKKNREGIT